MFKNAKKLQSLLEDQDLAVDGQFYLSEKDRKAMQKKAKKELKRAGKKYNYRESY